MSNPVMEALTSRRSASARTLLAPGPDDRTMALIVEAAAAAPDHGHLAPFRFVAFDDAGRGRLADALADAAGRQEGATEAQREKARAKVTEGASVLALVSHFQPDHLKIGMADQWLTLGGALQNLVLAAESFGFGVAIRSGGMLSAPEASRALGLPDGDEIVAIVAIGTKSETIGPRRKPQMNEVYRIYRG